MKTNLENYEERFVDYMESQLDASEMREVEAFVAEHPKLEDDFKLFCSTKLEPDTSVVFTKKESLVQPATVIRPLYVRIIAAAACLALLIGLGFRFLKPHQGLDQQPLLANLTPIKAQPFGISQETQGLRKSNLKTFSFPTAKPTSKHQGTKEHKSGKESKETLETTEPIENTELVQPTDLIAAVNPIKPKPLSPKNTIDHDDMVYSMAVELGERLAKVESFHSYDPSMESLLVDQGELAVASLQDIFVENVRQTTKNLYKRTAKTVMTIYQTTDYRLNEAKDQLVASR